MNPLTPRQREIFEYIHQQTRTNGFQPTMRELIAAFGITSPNGIARHLNAMKRKGWIQASNRSNRAMKFVLNSDGSQFQGFIPI